METTKTTTRPSIVVTRSVGTPVAAWRAVPPTRRPPKRNADRIVQSGFSAAEETDHDAVEAGIAR